MIKWHFAGLVTAQHSTAQKSEWLRNCKNQRSLLWLYRAMIRYTIDTTDMAGWVDVVLRHAAGVLLLHSYELCATSHFTRVNRHNKSSRAYCALHSFQTNNTANNTQQCMIHVHMCKDECCY
jgi:hypothetical protein